MEDSEALLRIHLERIRRHTTVPYAIYGAPLRLPARFHPQLASAGVRVHDLVAPDDVLSHVQHSTLLTALLARVVADGCTHVGTLHVDSFPIADGWVERMAAPLTRQSPVTAVFEEMEGDTRARPNLAGMLALADYWRDEQPFLIPPPELERSPKWGEFLRRHQQHVTHSGVGLGYCLEQSGKTWIPLHRTNSRQRHPVLAGIYADLIFHLGAATRPRSFLTDSAQSSESAAMRGRRKLASLVRRSVPSSVRRLLRPMRPLGRFYDNRPLLQNEATFAEIRGELFADPDDFIGRTMEAKLGERL